MVNHVYAGFLRSVLAASEAEFVERVPVLLRHFAIAAAAKVLAAVAELVVVAVAIPEFCSHKH